MIVAMTALRRLLDWILARLPGLAGGFLPPMIVAGRDDAVPVRIEGALCGDIHAAAVVIGAEATVWGIVRAERVTVHGCVEGGIEARTIVLGAHSRVAGIVRYEFLTIASGAHFEASCRFGLPEQGAAPAARSEAFAA